jgi:4-hydroxythreonine-4-phosphate dehydrogenase
MGEPAGIGPEIAGDVYAACDGRIGGRPLLLVGDPEVFQNCAELPDEAIIPTEARAERVPGQPATQNAAATIEAITLAVEMAMRGEAAAVVTAPIHKAVLMEAGFRFPGHTDYLAELTGAPRAVMMLMSETLRVVPLTAHIPLADVPRHITQESLLETAEILLEALKRDFAIAHPRLAVAGLNPHAGENGRLGREELDVLIPAIAELKARGAAVQGPLPADTMFHEAARNRYDAALCMYHDQALIPLKTLSFWEGVNVTLGLPIVRTSPDHGTGLDIAGRGLADTRSMLAALKLAAKMADARSQ